MAKVSLESLTTIYGFHAAALVDGECGRKHFASQGGGDIDLETCLQQGIQKSYVQS